jgi:tetratricopeptide (TPR) repeat protein
VHYARLHRALSTLDKQSEAARAALVTHLRTGPNSLGKVLSKGPLGDVLGTLAEFVPSDDIANLAVWQAVSDQLPEGVPSEILFDLGADLRAMGDAARALPHLETYTEEEGAEDAEAWLELGDARVDLADAQGALDAWEKSCALDDALAAGWARRGFLYAEIGMPDAAIGVLSEAVAREDDPEVWLTLGRCLLASGLGDDATDPLQRAIKGLDDDAPESLYMRGAAKALAGDADGAFNDLLAAGTADAGLLEAAQEDDDYLQLSSHPRWASITG